MIADRKMMWNGKKRKVSYLAEIRGVSVADFLNEYRACHSVARVIGKTYTYKGVTRSLKYWSRLKNIPVRVLRNRLVCKTSEDRIFMPVQKKNSPVIHNDVLTNEQRKTLESFKQFTHY